MTQHRKGPMSAAEKRRIRYSEVTRRLQARYTQADGNLIITVGGKPTRYLWLEAMACVKYLHCDPSKLGVPGIENVRINDYREAAQ